MKYKKGMTSQEFRKALLVEGVFHVRRWQLLQVLHSSDIEARRIKDNLPFKISWEVFIRHATALQGAGLVERTTNLASRARSGDPTYFFLKLTPAGKVFVEGVGATLQNALNR